MRMSGDCPFKVVFILGGPGSGKGTQCSKIVSEFGYVHLSAGELLREEMNKSDSKYGDMIRHHMRAGTIVPVAVTCGLLENTMCSFFEKDGKVDFLVDGFPRNQDNLDGWNTQMTGKAAVQGVVVLDCPADICIERCLGRAQAGSARIDDNADTLKRRLEKFRTETQAIIDHYAKLGLVHQVNGDKLPEDVFLDVKNIINSFKR